MYPKGQINSVTCQKYYEDVHVYNNEMTECEIMRIDYKPNSPHKTQKDYYKDWRRVLCISFLVLTEQNAHIIFVESGSAFIL